VQRFPGLFPLLRALVDRDRRPGRLLVLGPASPDLLHQSSESLAGRIAYVDLQPLSYDEVAAHGDLMQHWLRDGFPESFPAADEAASYRWREQFVRTITWYIDILESTFMVRLLRPYFRNTKKRLVRSPKIYLRDSGLLHTLLGLHSWDALFGHPAIGASLETYALEQILGVLPEWQGSFYRSSGGAEIDLVLQRGGHTVAVELKSTRSPRVSKGFYMAAEDIRADERYIVAPLAQPELIPYGHGAVLCRPESLIRQLSAP